MNSNLLRQTIQAVTLLLVSFATMASAVDPTWEYASLSKDAETNEQYIDMISARINNLSNCTEYVLTFSDLTTQNSGNPLLGFPENEAFTFKLYDHGGKNGNYNSDVNDTLSIWIPKKGYSIQVTGSIDTKEYIDRFTVFEGYTDKRGKTILDGLSGKIDDINFISKEDLVFVLKGDVSGGGYSGLDLTVRIKKDEDLSVECKNSVDDVGGAIDLCPPENTIHPGDTVKLTVTPKENYVFEGVEIKDVNGEPVKPLQDVGWYSGNKFSFIMPLFGVVVTPKFTNDVSHFSVNMPESDTLEVIIPQGVTSFKLYDDGGADKDYSRPDELRPTNRTLRLTAPSGYRIYVKGSMETLLNEDMLTVKDSIGCNENVVTLMDSWSGAVENIHLLSSGNGLTFDFEKSGFFTAASYGVLEHVSGFDFTVMVGKDEPHTLVCKNEDVEGGSIKCPEGAFSSGEKVSVEAMPQEGYVFAGLELKDASGNVVDVLDSWYPDNKASFAMLPMNLVVKPKFTKDLSNLHINMPENDSIGVVIPEGVNAFKVYDDGGKDGFHSINANGALTLMAPEGQVLGVVGDMETTYSNAKLSICDGESCADSVVKLVKAASGSTAIHTISSKGSLTIKFATESASAHSDKGLDLLVRVGPSKAYSVTCVDVVAGEITCEGVNQADYGQTVELSITAEAAKGYVLAGAEVRDENGNVVKTFKDFPWYKPSHKISFKMPLANVNVVPVFTDKINDLYINMPFKGTDSIVVPASVDSFKVYDDGGKDGKYSKDADGTLQMIAHDGYVLQVTGHKNINPRDDQYDYMSICDGPNCEIGTPKFITEKSGPIDSIMYISTGNAMTLFFRAYDNSSRGEGLDLTIRNAEKDVPHKVKCAENVAGGTIEECGSEVNPGEPVTLTVTPTTGYALTGIEIKDAYQNDVKVVGGQWYSGKTHSFIMPVSDVTVTPTFTNKLDTFYLNMPNLSAMTAIIPPGVDSIKVYDNGGKDGFYVLSSADTLRLFAQENYLLKVKGSMQTWRSDPLRVCDADNCGENATKFYGSRNDIYLLSTKNVLTFDFLAGKRDYDLNYHGFDFTVYAVPDVPHEIQCASNNSGGNANNSGGNANISGGSIKECSSGNNVGNEKAHTPVTLTAVPTNSVLQSVGVTDADGKLDVDGGSWYHNAFSFVMRASDVTVTPSFTTNYSNLYINMPTNDTVEAVIPKDVKTFKVFDDGGVSEKYSINANGFLRINAPRNYTLQVKADAEDIAMCDDDTLLVCNGRNCDDPNSKIAELIGGKNIENVSLMSSGTTISIRFKNIGLTCNDDYVNGLWVSTTEKGFKFTVNVVKQQSNKLTCVSATDKDGVEIGYIQDCPNYTIDAGRIVSLSAAAEKGYALTGYVVHDKYGNELVSGSMPWYSGDKTISFEMPQSEAFVKPLFTHESDLYVNIPQQGLLTLSVPISVTSFKVYDDGGKDGSPEGNTGGKLRVPAPQKGKVALVTGSLKDDIETRLEVTDNNGGEIFTSKLSDDISFVTTDTMTVALVPQSGSSMAELDLTVEYGDYRDYAVECVENVEGGTLACDKAKAKPGEKVTLTVTPGKGYVLDGIEVKKKNGNVINVDNVTWYAGNEFSFTMRLSDVTVMPIFKKSTGLFVNMPITESDHPLVVNIPESVTSFNVYDDGGKDGGYAINSDNGITEVLQLVAPKGKMLRVTGSAVVDGSTVWAFGYDGDFSKEPPYWSYESKDDIIFDSDENGLLYIYLNSRYDATSAAGLDLTVNVVDKDELEFAVMCDAVVVGGTFSCGKEKSKGNEFVTLSAEPAEGYKLAGYEVASAKESVVYALESSDNTASFEMPYADVSVKPVFVEQNSNFYADMPRIRTRKVIIPEGVTTLKVYDDGGKDGDYSEGSDGTLQIEAPPGYILVLSGTAETYSGDYLTIYNGAEGASTLIDKSYGSKNFNDAPLVSSGNVMTLYFESDYNSNLSGFDFTIRVGKDIKHKITCGNGDEETIEGGTIACSKAKSKYGKIVKWEATPEEGYVLAGVEVKDKDGVVSDVFTWYSVYGISSTNTMHLLSGNSATFRMPLTDVTVMPTFVKATDFYINMPKNMSDKYSPVQAGVAIPEGAQSIHIYDDGGKDGDYSDNLGGALLYVYAPKGKTLRVTGSAALVDGDDGAQWAFAYDWNNLWNFAKGYSYDENLVYWGKNSNDNINFETDENGELFIYFKAENSEATAAGLDLTVTVIDKQEIVPKDEEFTIACNAAVDGGTYKCLVDNNEVVSSKVKVGDIVKLTAKSADGFTFVGVEFVDIDKKAVISRVSFNGDSAWFAMPRSNVTVKPIFTTNVNNLSVNMPKTGMKAVSFAAGVDKFNVYDDGGQKANYSSNANGYLQLIAPEGLALKLSGSAETESGYDYLSIYGGGIDADKLVDKKSGDFDLNDGNALTSDILTLFLESDGSYCKKGLEFEVTFVEKTEHTITCVASVDGGTAACDKEIAKVGESFTLTATPVDGYILDSVVVTDAEGHVLKSMAWYEHPVNTASFTMQPSDVTVRPVFTKMTDLSVNMPSTNDQLTVYIPEGVKTFKIYDNGGKNGDYSLYVNGKLKLMMPEGYKILLKGSLQTSGSAYFNIYVNSSSNAVYSNEGTDENIENIDLVIDEYEDPEIYFSTSYYANIAAGLDLTVTLVKPENDFAAVSVGLDGSRLVAEIDGEYGLTDVIDIPEDIKVDSILFDREFKTDLSGFSTVMLPFDFDASNLEGVKSIIEFAGVVSLNGKDAVGMKYVWCNEEIGAAQVALGYDDCNKLPGVLTAYTPYIVEMASETMGFKGGATIKSTRDAKTGKSVKTGIRKKEWVFQGMLQMKTWSYDDTKDGNVWGYTGAARKGFKIGSFSRFGKGTYINPLRAYLLKTPGVTSDEPQEDAEPSSKASLVARRVASSPYAADDLSAVAQQFDASGRLVMADRTYTAGIETASVGNMDVVILNGGKDGQEHTTVIGRYDSRTGEIRMNFRPKHTYDLKGRRVNEGKKAKGVYYKK